MADPHDLLSLQAELAIAVDEMRLRRLNAELFDAVREGRLGAIEAVRILDETGAGEKLHAFSERLAGKITEEEVARRAVWEAEAEQDAVVQMPKPPRKPRPATDIKRIEKDTGKTVISYTRDGVTYTFGRATERQSDTDRELAEFEARHGKA